MQRLRSFGLHAGTDAGADVLRDRRHRRKSLRQRLEVEPGAADQDRYAAGGTRFIQHRLHVGQPASDRIVLGRIHVAIEPVRHARLFGHGRPCRDDVQVAINLHRVGVDDDAGKPLGQRQCQRRLAAGGRPCDKHRLSGGHVCVMTHVATLISNPARPALDDAHIAVAVGVLATAQAARVLDPGVAVDIPFTPGGADDKAVAERLRTALEDAYVDVVVQPLAARRKRLFVADMDSTMIGQECIDELADLVGLKEHVAAITERAMRGEIAFEPALRERVALLKGLPATVVEDVIAKRITLTPGGRELVNTMRQNGAYTCLVSGGFTLFTTRIATMIGFDENRGNVLLAADGKLAGAVTEPILGREAKLATLIELRQRLKLEATETLAVGDGANDLAMVEAAGVGVAYHAKPKM